MAQTILSYRLLDELLYKKIFKVTRFLEYLALRKKIYELIKIRFSLRWLDAFKQVIGVGLPGSIFLSSSSQIVD